MSLHCGRTILLLLPEDGTIRVEDLGNKGFEKKRQKKDSLTVLPDP
jgi:hypothetical protein